MYRIGILVSLAAVMIAGGIAAIVIATGGEGAASSAQADSVRARARLHDAAGNLIADVKLTQDEDGTEVKVEASNLTPGFHGFHIHTIGACEAPFTSAGGHYNPGGVSHANHAGDMPVLLVREDGTAVARFASDRFDVEDLFDADGSAIIIHAGPDNYANIPTARYDPDPDATTLATGDAGSRFACGVIES